MNTLLALPNGLETRYWSASSTQRQVRQADKLGLIMGVLMNYACYSLSLRPNDRGPGPVWPQVFFRVAVILQTLQLIWCLTSPNSYNRARLAITLLHRARVLAGMVYGYITLRSQLFFYSMISQLDVEAGRRRAFVGIMLSGPLVNFLSGLNHALPFKYQAVYTITNYLCYLAWGMRHQVKVVGIWGLTPWVRPTCEVMESFSLGPMLSRFGALGVTCRGAHATGLVMTFVHAVVGNLAALQVVYWQEYMSKAAWMKEQGLAEDDEGRGSSSSGDSGNGTRIPWLQITAYAWCSCALSWSLLASAHILAWHAAA
jgi:hypothetical protein